MEKILFIDRSTLINQAQGQQIESFADLQFVPSVIKNTALLAENTGYTFVLITSQQGLESKELFETQFLPVHDFIVKTFENEGVEFRSDHIEFTYPGEDWATLPRYVDMFAEYLNDKYDIANSYVICNNAINVKLAKDMGCKAILVGVTDTTEIDKAEELHAYIANSAKDWKEAYAFLRKENRTATVTRKTNETDITITVDLDGTGKGNISTGLHFFDHMLDQIARHSGVDLTITAKGDLNIDEHHTIEDTAITLGEVFLKALGDKKGIERYGFCLPMDDALAQVAIDFGGRNWIEWEAEFKREKVGDMPTEMFFHFFKSFSDAAKCNLNIKAEGDNEHHKIEAIFKAFAKAIKMAVKKDYNSNVLPSTKGTL